MAANRTEHAMQRAQTVKDVGMKVSTALHNAVLSGGEPARHAVDALHGKWLGHPLHPVLTDVVIGSWVAGGIFDAIGAATDSDSARKAADRLTTLGTLAAAPTAITGLADFSTFPEWAATPATLHGAGNVVATGLYAWSVFERRRGNRARGVLLSAIGLGLSCVTAWLGGVLVYKHKVGVDHSDRFTGPSEVIVDSGTVVRNVPTPPAGGCRTSFEVKMDDVEDARDVQGFHQVVVLCNHKQEVRSFCQLYGIRTVHSPERAAHV
jgi:uncharacterized membrane protein